VTNASVKLQGAPKSGRPGNRKSRPSEAASARLIDVAITATPADGKLLAAAGVALLGNGQHADKVRIALANAVNTKPFETAFDFIGSDLPDEYFDGVFDQPRPDKVRDIDP
jgi:hypothetical protein